MNHNRKSYFFGWCIWVRSDSSIAGLHETIQRVMGWSNEPLHRFVIRGVHYGANHIIGKVPLPALSKEP